MSRFACVFDGQVYGQVCDGANPNADERLVFFDLGGTSRLPRRDVERFIVDSLPSGHRLVAYSFYNFGMCCEGIAIREEPTP